MTTISANRPSNRAYRAGSRRQQGAVLVVGLVILLVVTTLGISGQQSTVLQERMAGNLRQNNIAFQAAESALQAALSYVEEQHPLTPTDTGEEFVWTSCTVAKAGAADGAADSHPCKRLDNSILPDWQQAIDDMTQGKDYEAVVAKLSGGGVAIPGVVAQPRVYIEVRQEPVSPDAQANSFGDDMTHYYTVTSIGFGETEQARAIVQSTIAL
jgi:Tfp pilus assembly protein PilX